MKQGSKRCVRSWESKVFLISLYRDVHIVTLSPKKQYVINIDVHNPVPEKPEPINLPSFKVENVEHSTTDSKGLSRSPSDPYRLNDAEKKFSNKALIPSESMPINHNPSRAIHL